MAKKAATPTPTQRTATGILDAEIERQRELFEATEEILRSAAETGVSTFSADERRVLAAAGFGTHHEQQQQLGRMQTVRFLVPRAGTETEYAAAQEDLAAARQKLATEGEELRDQMRAIGEKLDALTKTVEGPQLRLKDYDRNRERLRQAAPEYVKQRQADREEEFRMELFGPLQQLEYRIQSVRKLIDPTSSLNRPARSDGPAAREFKRTAERFLQTFVADEECPWHDRFGHIRSMDDPEADAAIKTMLREAPEVLATLEAEWRGGRDQCEKAKASIARALDFYILP